MPSSHRRVKRLAVTIACVGALGVSAAPASADSVSAYLQRETSLVGPCGGTYFRLQATGLAADPDGWFSPTKYVRTDVGGYFETNVWRRSGVKRYDQYIACSGSRNYRHVFTPTKYVHQFIDQNWYCFGGSCQYLYTNYESWVAGV